MRNLTYRSRARTIENASRREGVDAAWLGAQRVAFSAFAQAVSGRSVLRLDIGADSLRKLGYALAELISYRELHAEAVPQPEIWAAGVTADTAIVRLARAYNLGHYESYETLEVVRLDADHWTAEFVAGGVRYTASGLTHNGVCFEIHTWSRL